MYQVLLIIHIVAGFAALFSSFVAILTKMGYDHHPTHLISGRIFCWSMTGVFLTSVALTLIRPNMFLLVIAIFSFYLTYHGWRMALNRKGEVETADKAGAWVMILTAGVMLVTGIFYHFGGNSFGIVLFFFGLIGGFLAGQNLLQFRKGGLKGKDRISSHQGSMIGATIAAVTAFLVTNISTNPAWLIWIAPTVFMVPLIFLANRKIYRKRKSAAKAGQD